MSKFRKIDISFIAKKLVNGSLRELREIFEENIVPPIESKKKHIETVESDDENYLEYLGIEISELEGTLQIISILMCVGLYSRAEALLNMLGQNFDRTWNLPSKKNHSWPNINEKFRKRGIKLCELPFFTEVDVLRRINNCYKHNSGNADTALETINKDRYQNGEKIVVKPSDVLSFFDNTKTFLLVLTDMVKAKGGFSIFKNFRVKSEPTKVIISNSAELQIKIIDNNMLMFNEVTYEIEPIDTWKENEQGELIMPAFIGDDKINFIMQQTGDIIASKKILLIGFDSAWTLNNRGAIVGVIRKDDGEYQELGLPKIANFAEASQLINEWRRKECPVATIVLLDQPAIVRNAASQRPVENIVASPVGRRYGGVQPSNTSRTEMFGSKAPIWEFLEQFGGSADPLSPMSGIQVFETYPVLALIALDWLLQDERATGRLPKYNPILNTFSTDDWEYVCSRLLTEIGLRQLSNLATWIGNVKATAASAKEVQDGIDACICLLSALYMVEHRKCLMVGNIETGYMVVPYGEILKMELEERCRKINHDPTSWVKEFVK